MTRKTMIVLLLALLLLATASAHAQTTATPQPTLTPEEKQENIDRTVDGFFYILEAITAINIIGIIYGLSKMLRKAFGKSGRRRA
jgi:hypothetical protein